MNKNDLRYLKTEDLIRETFLDALGEKPLEQLTVTALCARARISRFTFYTHYADLYALKAALLSTLEENLNRSITPELLSEARRGNFVPSARRYVRDILANRHLLRPLLKCDPDALEGIIRRTFLDSVTALYVKGYEQITQACRDVQFVRAFYAKTLTGYAQLLLADPAPLPEEEAIRRFYDLVGHTGSCYIHLLQSKGPAGAGREQDCQSPRNTV